MKKLLVGLIAACLSIAPAWADGTIDTLTAAAALSGTESIPIFQTANPAVKTTPSAISTYLQTLGVYATLGGNNTFTGNNLWTGAPATTNTNGQATIGGDAVNGAIIRGKGSTSDLTLMNNAANGVCTIATGATSLSCARVQVTSGTASGNGVYLPAANTVGFMANGVNAGSFTAALATLPGGIKAAALATTGTIAGALCQDSSGNFIYNVGANCIGIPNFATSFLFGGSGTTSVPATSASYANPPANATINVTAGSGVTNLTAQIQATPDNTNWTTIGTINLTAPGTGYLVVSIPYLGLRVNVTQISGGTAAANITSGQSKLVASPGTVLTNPQLTGVAVPGPYLAYQSGIPVILPSSGSIGNNGALTLTTGLPGTYPSCWMYFPSGAISSGSAAGVYFVQMSSGTAGTIFNNVLSSGVPTIPASPTPFVTTGPGAYTQTGSVPNLITLPILGGSMGNNGSLRYSVILTRPNTADVIGGNVLFGSTQIATNNSGSGQQWLGFERVLQNRGAQNSQVSLNTSTSLSTDYGTYGNAPGYSSIDTSQQQNFVIQAFIGTADFIVIERFTIEVLPAN